MRSPLVKEYTGEKLDDESYVVDENLPEYIEENKKQKEAFAGKFQIDFEESEYRESQYLWGKKLPKLPFNNVLSGAKIDLRCGEGILDFIYADFKSAIKEQMKTIELENLLREFAKQEGIKKPRFIKMNRRKFTVDYKRELKNTTNIVKP